MMKELVLKYGCNPNQTPSRVYRKDGDLPFQVLNGKPGYINLLDALNGYQLVRELKEATGLPAATSFKHVSPAGAALGLPLSPVLEQIYFTEGDLSPLACAYARARGTDRMSSFGDFIALSDPCDLATAKLIAKEVTDGVIAPAYFPEALELLKTKRKGTYVILQVEEDYKPAPLESKEVYGITFEQGRNQSRITEELFKEIGTRNQDLPPEIHRDLLVALITLKYTQSNSVCYVKDGQTIGVGAGQQSRIHCTRLAGNKTDRWMLRQHKKVLALSFRADLTRAERDNCIDVYLSEDWEDVIGSSNWERFFTRRPDPLTESEKREWIKTFTGVVLGSDAFFPFEDNIYRAAKSGVTYVVQPGGSIRDQQVIAACDQFNMVMLFTGLRLFHH